MEIVFKYLHELLENKINTNHQESALDLSQLIYNIEVTLDFLSLKGDGRKSF